MDKEHRLTAYHTARWLGMGNRSSSIPRTVRMPTLITLSTSLSHTSVIGVWREVAAWVINIARILHPLRCACHGRAHRRKSNMRAASSALSMILLSLLCSSWLLNLHLLAAAFGTGEWGRWVFDPRSGFFCLECRAEGAAAFTRRGLGV